jgi:Flp pilus assembly protein TadG
MLANLRARMRGFLKATGGNIAMTMALAAVPLVLATGAGIDYGRGLVAHSNMADALDAAALAVGKQTTKPSACSTASGSTSTQQTACAGMQAVAQKFFDANYKGDTLTGGTQPTVVITIANSGVIFSATDSVNTTFLAAGGRLLGTISLNTMAITASSTVVWGQTKLWVALVLNNSGSMSSSNKMTNLKTAAGNLLNTLQDASTTVGDVQVALVPFDREINVGTGNVAAS